MTNVLKSIQILKKEARLILGILLRKGPLTMKDIQEITNMKLSTLVRIMKHLEHKGLISGLSVGESTGGRKPVIYGINPRYAYVAGIDISRTYINMVVTDLKMDMLIKQQIPMVESSTPQQVTRTIREFLGNALNRLAANKDAIIGIGIGTVGPLDRVNGVMLNPGGFPAPGWDVVPIKRMVEEATGIPVLVDNGANTAVLAEHVFGEGRNFDSIAYVNCGVGIRNSAISAGIIVRAINNAEDALGHMTVDVDGELCTCGNYGCLERYCSIPSVVRKFTAELKKGRVSAVKKPINSIDYTDICVAAENGDELAKEVITGAAAMLGVGLANYINLLSPELVIISGPLVMHSTLFFKTSRDIAVARVRLKNDAKVSFSRGGLFTENSMALGAATAVTKWAFGV